jgi:hypothetical protein
MAYQFWTFCTLHQLTHFITLPYPSPKTNFWQLSVHFIMPSSYTDATNFDRYCLLSFPLPPLSFPLDSPTMKHVLYMCIWSCLYLCKHLYFVFIFHKREKTCHLFLSEPELLCITWHSPVVSIYLQPTISFHSLWASNTPFCVYTTFSVSFKKNWKFIYTFL